MRIVATFTSGSLLFLFCHTGSMWEFLGQGPNLRHTAATRAAAVRTQEPHPARPSEDPQFSFSAFDWLVSPSSPEGSGGSRGGMARAGRRLTWPGAGNG